jgi:hypothetical protein
MKREQRTLCLSKGRHQYLFRYEIGQEAQLLAAFMELARDAHTDFDWVDAFVMSYRVSTGLESGTLVAH